MTKRLVALTITLVTLALIGGGLWSFVFHGSHDTILSMTSFAIGTTAFFGIIAASQSSDSKGFFSKDHLRTAITGAVLITYLFILCFSVFIKTPSEMSQLTTSLINSLTSLVTVTIAFYFGASAAVQILGKSETNKENSKTES
jgi:hypothetical protein